MIYKYYELYIYKYYKKKTKRNTLVFCINYFNAHDGQRVHCTYMIREYEDVKSEDLGFCNHDNFCVHTLLHVRGNGFSR